VSEKQCVVDESIDKNNLGGVPERLIGTVSKTVARGYLCPGFESLPLRFLNSKFQILNSKFKNLNIKSQIVKFEFSIIRNKMA
jgi:hypothetical protein